VSAPSIRIAGVADLPAIHALIERAYRGDSARAGWTHESDLLSEDRTSLAELAAIVGDSDKRILIAEQGGAIVGCVEVTKEDEGVGYFGMLTVDPALQAGGLGKILIAAAEAEAVRTFGATRMELAVVDKRPELIAYYERRGYVATGEVKPFPAPEAIPLDLLVYSKPLI
jgi:N-acetylglutamate synthase-like GNAT family acetyltransferase